MEGEGDTAQTQQPITQAQRLSEGWDTLLMIVEGTAILGPMAQGSFFHAKAATLTTVPGIF